MVNITDIISITISVVGFLLAFYIYLRDKRDKVRRELAREVVAYYRKHTESTGGQTPCALFLLIIL